MRSTKEILGEWYLLCMCMNFLHFSLNPFGTVIRFFVVFFFCPTIIVPYLANAS